MNMEAQDEHYEDILEEFLSSILQDTGKPRGVLCGLTSDIEMRQIRNTLLNDNKMEDDEDDNDFQQYKACYIALKHHQKDRASILINVIRPEMLFRPNDYGVTPIELAIKRGYKDLVETMLHRAPWSSLSQHTQNVLLGSSIVRKAISSRDLEMLQMVLKNMPALINSSNQYGRNPLSHAAHKGYFEEACYLLDTFPNCATLYVTDGRIPLHYAISKGRLKIVKKLLQCCPETMNYPNKKGQKPLSIAAHEGHTNIVCYMLESFPNYANICDEDGCFPIHKAVAAGRVDVVKEFLSYCPETIHLIDAQGRSILHIVVECAKADVLKYLKTKPELKQIYRIRDVNGNTFADLAKQSMMKINSRKAHLEQMMEEIKGLHSRYALDKLRNK